MAKVCYNYESTTYFSVYTYKYVLVISHYEDDIVVITQVRAVAI